MPLRRFLPLALLIAAAPAPRGVAALNDPVRLVAAGQDLEARGQLAQAMGFYDQALSVDPANAAALMAAGSNALRRGDGADAYAYYTALTRARPKEAQGFLGLGASLILRLQPSEALTALATAETLGAPRARVQSQRGLAYDLLGDHRSAQVAYAGALALEPDNIEPARRLALSLSVSGSRAAALQVMRRFEGDPQSAVPLRQTLALVYALTGDPETADEIARSILPSADAKQMSMFFAALPALNQRDKTMAALFGRLPGNAAPAPAAQARAVEAAAPPAPKRVPVPAPVATAETSERLWLQLASVADASRIGEAWRAARKAGGDAPDLKAPRSAPGPRGTRLLIGPYAGRAEANAAVLRLKARGIDAFPVTTPRGTEVSEVGP